MRHQEAHFQGISAADSGLATPKLPISWIEATSAGFGKTISVLRLPKFAVWSQSWDSAKGNLALPQHAAAVASFLLGAYKPQLRTPKLLAPEIGLSFAIVGVFDKKQSNLQSPCASAFAKTRRSRHKNASLAHRCGPLLCTWAHTEQECEVSFAIPAPQSSESR